MLMKGAAIVLNVLSIRSSKQKNENIKHQTSNIKQTA